MNRRIVELREAITKLVQLLAGKGLRVTQIGSQAYVKTDPRTLKPISVNIPNIPDNASDELIAAIQGFVDHECAHVLFTDWSIVLRAYDFDRRKEGARKGGRMASLHNIMEDSFIERRMGETFPGAKFNIARTGRFFLEKVSTPNTAAAIAKGDQNTAFGYIMVPMMRAIAGQDVFQEWMDDNGYWQHPHAIKLLAGMSDELKRKIPLTRTSSEVYALAEEVYAILYPEKPPEPQGKGKGEKEHQEDSDQASGDEPSDDQADNDETSEAEGETGEGEEPQDEGQSGDATDEDQDADEAEEAEGSSEDAAEEDEGDGGSADEEDDDEDGADDEDEGASGNGDESDPDAPETDEGSAGDDDGKDEGDPDEGEAPSAGDGEDEDDADDASDQDAGAGDDDEADDEASAGASDDDGDDEEVDEPDASENEAAAGNETDEDDGSKASSGSDSSDDEAGDEEDGGADEEEGDDEAEGGGNNVEQNRADMDEEPDQPEEDSGYGESFSPEEAPELAGMDLANQVAEHIQEAAMRSIDEATYSVFTTDFDIMETLEVEALAYQDEWLVSMDEQTRTMIGQMQKDVERMMASRSRSVNVPGFRSGRIHSANLHRLMAGDDRVFRKREEHRSKATAVSLVCDLSGSMGGPKYQTAMIAAYALAQTLERVNVANEVMGFTTAGYQQIPQSLIDAINYEAGRGIHYSRQVPMWLPLFKTFEERLTPVVKKRFAYAANQQPGMGGNVDGESIERAAVRLLRRQEERKVLIVFSDGHPAGGEQKACEWHLKQTVQQLEKSGVDVIGIGIMDASVRSFYTKSVVLPQINLLPKVVMNELKAILLK
ncbi:cobaltochelatase CobT-related protein [Aureimonas sp. AU40]|uniref:cobaltochelatase CobT-related protein n=1 Tax=Aureimonas sp. AU40 TaxID=1637747 RepID=UPI000784BB1F|nr:VWA domain-containing protein [Aureimonas sp. AU40]